MSGTTIPYHLRPNKAVERNIFIETLSRLGRYANINEYAYIGFGGPFLEDFKAIHVHLGIDDLTSIEMDSNVIKRQEHNKPLNCVTCKLIKSGDFITQHPFAKKTIIWLDYVSANDLNEQLNDIEFLMSKLSDYDILKVTLNAHFPAIADTAAKGETLQQARMRVLKRRAGKFLPTGLKDSEIRGHNFPKILCQILENAIKSGASGRKRSFFQPLTAFVYADGQTMITLTGIILPDHEEKIAEFYEKTQIDKWLFSNTNWGNPKTISVPHLSLKERIKIEEMLPNCEADQIQATLDYFVADSPEKSLDQIKNYIEYYRQFPYFSRVLV